MRGLIRVAGTLGLAASLAACAHRTQAPQAAPPPPPGRHLSGPVVDDQHVPPFANAGWAPFSRAAAIAIAQREWHLFGGSVDDDPPNSRPDLAPEDRPERREGMWQRVGEYWWEAMPPGADEASFTALHNGQGTPVADDAPWSAAFISYVMRIAGAASRFPYGPSHSIYINAAMSGASPVLRAHPPETYAPMPGDLICTTRAGETLRFADLPTSAPFASHCDIVIAATRGELDAVGGNVDDAVTLKHVPITPAGLIADPRYAWFVVLEVLYDPPPQP